MLKTVDGMAPVDDVTAAIDAHSEPGRKAKKPARRKAKAAKPAKKAK